MVVVLPGAVVAEEGVHGAARHPQVQPVQGRLSRLYRTINLLGHDHVVGHAKPSGLSNR